MREKFDNLWNVYKQYKLMKKKLKRFKLLAANKAEIFEVTTKKLKKNQIGIEKILFVWPRIIFF